MLAYVDGKTIAYTGDISLYGARTDLTKDFVSKSAKEKPEAFKGFAKDVEFANGHSSSIS